MVEKIWDSPEIFRILVELPDNPLRSLNSYVIRTPDRSLVIDTGFNRPECRAALWAGLEELELDLTRTGLFLTHLHSDHIGLVWDFVDRGVPVYMGAAEHAYYTDLHTRGFKTLTDPIFAREGMPREMLERQDTGNQGRLYSPEHGFPALRLKDRQVFSLGDVRIEAILTPGHTPGHTALYLPQEQLLFTGDHILFDITPNISVWPGISHSLSDYIASLVKTRALPIRAAFPAHRSAGEDVYRRIDQIIEHHGQRLDEIYQTVCDEPGLNAYEVAGRIKWSARGLAWEDFPPHQCWFAMGETIAHLVYLSDKGQLIRNELDCVARYYPASGSLLRAAGKLIHQGGTSS